eukprot:TRINITY_DN2016_c0_g1_i4.p2 TRINITY_DN2016_c0_g1~~TRINITY_DN2016_c0_g1_i4.p2  ORF type:complete len:184 (-),score=39.64 TRINITY_DN2016_c0_g1_i4:1109-1660(-)
MRSYRYIRLTKRNTAAFMDNLVAAFTALDSRRGTSPGLTGAELRKLLRLVCVDFPAEAVSTIISIVGRADSDLVEFSEFAAGVNACLLYEDFFEQAELLFKACDTSGQARVAKSIYLACLQQFSLQHSEQYAFPPPEDMEKAILHATNGAKGAEDISFREFVHGVFLAALPDKLRGAQEGETK